MLSGVSSFTQLQLIGELLELSLFVVVVAAGLPELVQELRLVLLFDAVELTELLKLGNKRVDHLQTFEELCAALLVTPVLLTSDNLVLLLEVSDLVAEGVGVPLPRSQLHHLLPERVEQCIGVSIDHSHRLCGLRLQTLRFKQN